VDLTVHILTRLGIAHAKPGRASSTEKSKELQRDSTALPCEHPATLPPRAAARRAGSRACPPPRIDAGEFAEHALMAWAPGFTRARVSQLMDLPRLAPHIQDGMPFLEVPPGSSPSASGRVRPRAEVARLARAAEAVGGHPSTSRRHVRKGGAIVRHPSWSPTARHGGCSSVRMCPKPCATKRLMENPTTPGGKG
jgi:hypothetical protein